MVLVASGKVQQEDDELGKGLTCWQAEVKGIEKF